MLHVVAPGQCPLSLQPQTLPMTHWEPAAPPLVAQLVHEGPHAMSVFAHIELLQHAELQTFVVPVHDAVHMLAALHVMAIGHSAVAVQVAVHALFTHAGVPLGQSAPVLHSTHLAPLVSQTGVVIMQAPQEPPPAPHAPAVVPGWHILPSQHPPLQYGPRPTTAQVGPHFPPVHAIPTGHSAVDAHVAEHVPATHAGAAPEQTSHEAPDPHAADVVPGRHWLPPQHPPLQPVVVAVPHVVPHVPLVVSQASPGGQPVALVQPLAASCPASTTCASCVDASGSESRPLSTEGLTSADPSGFSTTSAPVSFGAVTSRPAS
jgi:hypothetical protein